MCGPHIDCISFTSSHTWSLLDLEQWNWYTTLRIPFPLPCPPPKPPGAWSPAWTQAQQLGWPLRAIDCCRRPPCSTHTLLWLHRAPIRCFHRNINYKYMVLFLRGNSFSEHQPTFFFCFFFPQLLSDQPPTGHSRFRVSPNYFQPFNKSPPFGFKMFRCLIIPPSKKYALFLMTFIPK